MLPPIDHQLLSAREPGHSVCTEAGLVCVLIPRFELPLGFSESTSDLLIRLSPGYPDVPPDMWWFDPAIRRTDGQEIPCTQSMERYLGREWQRWSRHLTAGQWRSGVDSLESYIAIIRRELDAARPRIAP